MRRIIKVVGQPQLGTLFAAWSPLKQPLFRAVWIAALVSNVGTLMQSTGGAWLITSLTDSPLLIALMTTATSLPLVLLCLPGGALADIGDKKRLLIISHLWMFGAAMILGILSFTNNITSLSLLLLTFVMGVGNAITFPAWMATLSEIVDKKYLSKALTLNSLSYNISLIIGPLLAALFLAQFSVGWIFIVNALSFVAILGVIRRGKDEVIDTNLPKEELMSALRISFRYTKHHPQLRSLLYRTALVIFFGSAFWGLFPSVARFTLNISAYGFGILYGFMGIGSILAAAFLPRIQRRFTTDQRIAGATVIFAASLCLLAFPPLKFFIYVAMFGFGLSWITLMACFNVYVQSVVSTWIKARAIGMYMVVFQLAMTIGSVIWGMSASSVQNPTTLLIAALGMIATLIGIKLWPLKTDEEVDVTPHIHWAAPEIVAPIHHRHGPVLISVVYTINPKEEEEFVQAASKLGRIRRRDGAIRWSLYKDTAKKNTYIENFVVESWGEHLRQHHRFTNDDKKIQDKVRSFHKGVDQPLITHYIAKALY